MSDNISRRYLYALWKLIKHHKAKSVAALGLSLMSAAHYKFNVKLKIFDVLSYVRQLIGDVLDPKRMLAEKKNPVRVLMGMLWNSSDKSSKYISLMFILGVLRTGLMHLSTSITKDLERCVHHKDRKAFVGLLGRSALIAVGGSAINNYFTYARECLAVEWRSTLTSMIHDLYLNGISYYQILNLQGREQVVDADERIGREVYSVTKRLAIIVSLLAKALPHISWFTFLLYRSRGWSDAVFPHVYLGLAYEVAQRLFPKDMGIRYRTLSAASSTYSRSASRLRAHSESVAALGGDQIEQTILKDSFKGVQRATRSVSNGQSRFSLIFKTLYVYGSRSWVTSFIFLPMVSSAAPVSVGTEISELRHALGLLMEMLIANGELLTMHAQARHMWGMSARLTKMMHSLNKLGKKEETDNVVTGDHISFEGVDISTPTGHLLVKDLSFDVPQKTGRLLLTGFNGAGKSSIFRCLGGLWEATGKITKPGSRQVDGLASEVFYLPQKPYNVHGTLLDQLCYPAPTVDLLDDQVSELLNRVDLGHLLRRKNEGIIDWDAELSLGEMQRFSIARLLYQKPSFAILDECTSACSGAIEKLLYSECDRLQISYITICHRPQLREYHTANLELQGKGNWEMKSLPKVPIERVPVDLQRSSSVPHLPHAPVAPPDSRGKLRKRSAFSKLWTLTKLLLPATGQHVALLCGVLGLRTMLAHMTGRLVARLFKATVSRDSSTFWFLTGLNAAQDLLSAGVDEGVVVVGARLSEKWHSILAGRTTEMLFRNRAYYNVTQHCPDWDSRITSEIAQTATDLSTLVSAAITPAADAIFFASQLYGLVGASNVAILGAYVGGLALVIPMVRPDHEALLSRERQLESSFKGLHSRIVQHAESIAFFDGGAKEKHGAEKQLAELIEHQLVLKTTTARSDAMIHAISKDWTTYSSYVCAPALLSMWVQLRFAEESTGDLSSTYYVKTAVDRSIGAFGKLSAVAQAMVSLLGSSGRLFELMDALKESDSGIHQVTIGGTISVQGVDIVTPESNVLASGLTFEMPREQSLICVGPNGSGKTSVFRVLAGLWPHSNGSVQRPADLFLIPQRVYSVPGTLASQITYPDPYEPSQESRVLKALQTAGVEYLASRFENGLMEVKRWEDTLSLGEQQRIGFSRVFFHQPSCCVLDECSDAISAEAESGLYASLKDMDVSCLTISKRLELPDFHSQELRLGAPNTQKWQLLDLTK